MDTQRCWQRLIAGLITAVWGLTAVAPLAVAESVTIAAGAVLCTKIEHVAEHARIVRETPTSGLSDRIEAFVAPLIASGGCLALPAEKPATVIGVDQRAPGFAQVQLSGQSGSWWTDAESAWGYFEAPKKLKSWKK